MPHSEPPREPQGRTGMFRSARRDSRKAISGGSEQIGKRNGTEYSVEATTVRSDLVTTQFILNRIGEHLSFPVVCRRQAATVARPYGKSRIMESVCSGRLHVCLVDRLHGNVHLQRVS